MKCGCFFLLTSDPLSLPDACYHITALLLSRGKAFLSVVCCGLGKLLLLEQLSVALESQQWNCAGKITTLHQCN